MEKEIKELRAQVHKLATSFADHVGSGAYRISAAQEAREVAQATASVKQLYAVSVVVETDSVDHADESVRAHLTGMKGLVKVCDKRGWGPPLDS